MLLPQFNHIIASKIQPALENILKGNLKKLENDSLKDPLRLLEQLDNRLQLFWSPISHLHAVKSTQPLREAYAACLPLLSDYETTLSHHQKLYQAFKNYSPQNSEEKRIVSLQLRDFRLSGADLSETQKKRFAQIEKDLSQLETKFGENVLDATQAFEYQIDPQQEAELLKGIPTHLIPENKILTLDYPCYSAIQKYAENRELRELFYRAYVTRASDVGNQPQFDNTPLMENILLLRQEMAELLGFQNYVEYSLQTKMAKTPQQVLEFLNHLVDAVKPKAHLELKELNEYAKFELSPWDVSFYSEKLNHERYNIQQESFRPYFKTESVVTGLFTVISKLYQLSIRKRTVPTDVWHETVECYEIHDKNDALIGIFYCDLYARKLKRDGAWMDDFCSRYRINDHDLQTPIAFLTCNFLGPSQGLTHDDVITLFHECGHTLHHLLTKIDRIDIAGIHGVPWDAVELPSQFMENFCWQPEVLKLISNNTLPQELMKKLLESRYFIAGLQLIRQLEFGLFDFHLHLQKPVHPNTVIKCYQEISRKVSVIKKPEYARFPQSFTHIFDGGYSAAYYSYLWAEVLSCDAFGAFEETGIFNPQVGKLFLDKLLSQGGSEEPEILFRNFRGRDPNQKAFLKSWGLR
jgi:oligopeptidase A